MFRCFSLSGRFSINVAKRIRSTLSFPSLSVSFPVFTSLVSPQFRLFCVPAVSSTPIPFGGLAGGMANSSSIVDFSTCHHTLGCNTLSNTVLVLMAISLPLCVSLATQRRSMMCVLGPWAIPQWVHGSNGGALRWTRYNRLILSLQGRRKFLRLVFRGSWK